MHVRRLAAIDWLLIGVFMPIFLFGLVMSVVHGVRGDFVCLPFIVSSAPDAQSYPIVRRILSPLSAETGPLAVGDQVVRLEGSELLGVSTAGFLLRWSAEAQAGRRSLQLTSERASARSDVRVPLVPGLRHVPGAPWWAGFPLQFSLIGTALLLLVRAGHWHPARRFFAASLLVGIGDMPYFFTPTLPWARIISGVLVAPLAFGLTLWTLCEFIPGLRLWGSGARTVAWALGLLRSAGLAAMFWLPDAGPAAVLMRMYELPLTGFVIAWLAALTIEYRRSGPLGRRQIKWVVYGFYVGTLPFAVFNAALSLDIIPEWSGALMVAAEIAPAAVPLGILVAIAFYQFLDIDRLFSATLSYSVLAILGIVIVLSVLPTAARAASAALGLDPVTGQVLLAVALAAVLVPADRVVRPQIDRLLFTERVALEQGFERLLAEISGCADTEALTALVGERLDALLRPASTVLYARNGEVYTPMSVRGRTAPPAFATQSGLIATLQESATPLAAERWTARRTATLTPFERATLQTLDVAVLMPIRRGPDLVAFLCLGPKRSGDIYTPTDLALLGGVAGKISDRLLALDATAVVEQARAMQEALRRYVPGAVAQRIVSGQAVEASEREVTVLFVDIRGYTGFSEPREAEEIFGTVNRYTETVSQLVQARGGVVVEFHGDGMLAVFGAPDELPMKERAAVQAARDIVAAIATLPGPGDGTQPALSVGVGIATGPAFVGNIQSADRFIWTVIGNTVNLAARLQSLTREFDAAVAIDDTTFRRSARGCTDFVRHSDFPIRGRTQPETVHALPL
jgi:class 3 adenylate cyclase